MKYAHNLKFLWSGKFRYVADDSKLCHDKIYHRLTNNFMKDPSKNPSVIDFATNLLEQARQNWDGRGGRGPPTFLPSKVECCTRF